jgi:hypothetical protein|tara:strand:- start:240 stop:449 length:210 start_codon:yes stop_codon:yes gene_type:complete
VKFDTGADPIGADPIGTFFFSRPGLFFFRSSEIKPSIFELTFFRMVSPVRFGSDLVFGDGFSSWRVSKD